MRFGVAMTANLEYDDFSECNVNRSNPRGGGDKEPITGGMRSKSRSFIELFAGAGLLSTSFIKEGFKPIVAVEQDPTACQSYRRNVGEHVVEADVCKLKCPEHCDVLVAGPPCQGFSTLNRARKMDKRNRLVFEVIRWVKECGPSIVVVENVAPFAKSDECMEFCLKLEKLGYSCDVTVLDAADFGTAQSRKRSILIASRKDIEVCLEGPRARKTTVAEAWKRLPSAKTDPIGVTFPIPTPLAKARFELVPIGGDRRNIMNCAPALAPPSWFAVAKSDNTGVWGRMRWDQPSPTIRTAFQNPSKGRYIHPELHRVITIREGARLQDIPDSWQFFGSASQITRQIGNGVPLNLGEMIARACSSALRH